MQSEITYERRKGIDPIPSNLKDILTDPQMMAVNNLERIGWELVIVRRPLFLSAVPILKNTANNRFAVLREEGLIELDSRVKVRQQLNKKNRWYGINQ
ncbi:MAG: hypothetical protein KZQ92_14935 [Candidatus Thiodiazotropha sp. (ex Lucinoma borealis)]|nr:hypothetical protein [Candidatus Thiodiazotropha sp. (ex Lucinoma borealis)]MCU7838982.1 hypothetical protein [Candidatus Thiodiazotropha sp. (ex Troendleina suluensis)]MCU7865261.1 hypothetical protein [Candidatus Thiodiazotropha sp. (ex Lucinoma borealis)]MCU7947295.1 hypothetical protein [Candidatus Thiodiazotropha sp. (ex Cardiolucina cf. quadrata)]